MIRVFHVITHFDMGGAENVAINIAKSQSDEYEYHLIEVERATGAFSDSLISELKRDGIRLHRSWIKNGKLAILLFWIKFLFLIVRWKPNVIHTHTEKPDMALYIWHSLFGWIFPHIKYIRTIHNTQLWNDWKNIGKYVEAFFIKHHSNVAISSSTQECYHKTFGGIVPPIIYNGLPEVVQEKFEGVDSSKINILFAGRLEPQKGVDIMIKVFEKFASDEQFRFFIVGNGSLSERVRTSLNKYKRITIIDKVFGLSRYLASFDYLFMPSVHEGLALMSIEASMAKVPIIINDCPGLKDTLPETWELSAHNNNFEDYERIFSSLYKMDRKLLGLKAYQYAKANFSMEKMQRAYEAKYKQICGF